MSAELPADQPAQRLTGQVLANRYLIETKLGEGAMGAVYRAKHVKVGRAFAVKVLHPHLVIDNKLLQRFEREAELAGRLRHPNVIGVVDVGETPDGMRYMVMDFAAGPDLAALLDEAPFPPPRVINLTRQLLEGLYHAHEQGLVHRDLKPENVIVEKDQHGGDVARIVDFGIAILREGGDSTAGPGRLTTNGLVLGTPHYMAPEQAVADPIDHRIDLFALGIIIYEMLSGKLPFDGSGAEVARANLLLDPPAIADRVPYLEVDPLLEAFARRLMAKKRDDRPATAKAARELLDLVERDREAAARALRVPVEKIRAPQTTQPSQPLRQHTGHETFPPPIREAAQPPQAPPMTAPKAVAASAREAHLTTLEAEPPKRRVPLIAAAVAGVAVIGAAAFVALSGGDKPKQSDPQVAVAPEPVKAEPPKAEPPKAEPPVETKPAEVAPPPVEATPAEIAAPAAPPEAPITHAPPKPPKSGKKTTSQATTKPTVGTTPNRETSQLDKPGVAKPVTSQLLASQYQSVGNQLKALQDAKGADAASDLWARYRMIRLVDAMSTQPKRDAAAAILSKLAVDAAARKK